MADDPTVELVCRSGHKSVHLLARVLSHDNAWCTRCGADLKLDPLQLKALAARKPAADIDPEEPSKVAVRRVGVR